MKKIFIIILFIILTLAAFIFFPLIGDKVLPFMTWFGGPGIRPMDHFLLFTIRLPQALLAFLAGLALAVAGHVFQTVFRNDLADPYLLGISSASAFGVVLSVKLSLVFTIFFFSSISIFAFLSGILSILFIILLQSRNGKFSNYTVVLTGVALNLFFSALILGLYYFSDPGQIFTIQRWLMGSIDVIGYSETAFLAVTIIPIFGFLCLLHQDMNMLLLDDNVAGSRGLNTFRTKIFLTILCSLLVSVTVSVAGPLSFVGLIVPHAVKLIFGRDHGKGLLLSGLFGGLFLMLCWMISRTIVAPAVLPVGIVTALAGVPFFIWLISKKK